MSTYQNSESLFERARRIFPGGVNSPVRAFKSVEGSPPFMKKGQGAYMWDEDDNKYLDFCCSWGPLILGHNNPLVREAIHEATNKGCTFGTPTKYGVEIGELIVNNNRFIDKLRFVSSGTEAVMSAIRLARGYTGKSKIVKFEGCYHGHVDSLMVKAGSGLATFGVSTSAGIPSAFAKETLVVPLNDLQGFTDLLQEKSNDIAAVIIEPLPANNGLLIQDTSYLSWLRKICDDHNVLLIFDEVISGFRVGFEGAAGLYSIHPDIITYGKIIGGGMPVGAYGGRSEIMAHIAPDGPVYQAGTLSANPVTMAAGIATLTQLLKENFYTDLEKKTSYLCELVNNHISLKGYQAKMIHVGSIFWLQFTKNRIFRSDQISAEGVESFKKIHKYLLDRGIYLGPSGYEVGFVSSEHTKDQLACFGEYLIEALDYLYNA
jgi:glutamate-1-semialdehyde 2,1-aminomutase